MATDLHEMSRCTGCGATYAQVHEKDCPIYLTTFERIQSGVGVSPEPTAKVKSDGSSSSYYFLPKGATELNDLIEHKEMSFARGNLFKALYRLGEKDGIDHTYDLNKCQLFLDRLKDMQAKGRRL